MKKMCPRCGKLEGSATSRGPLQFVGSFCAPCFIGEKIFFTGPKGLFLQRCKRCNRARLKGDWVPYSDELLIEWIVPKLRSEGLKKTTGTVKRYRGNLVVDLLLEFLFSGVKIEKGAQVRVALDENACLDCSKQSGGYHEAIIQVRGGTGPQRERMVKTVLHELDKRQVNSAVSVLKEGLDVLVADRKTAQQVVMGLSREVTTSFTLAGEKEGKRLFKATFCVRLPQPREKREAD